MSKKIFINITLSIIVLLTLIFFFIKFTEKKNSKNNIIEKKPSEINLITNLEYTSIDKSGNSYKITAKTGKPDEKNNFLINLKNVRAEILLINNEKIIILSNKAIYNNNNHDTKFFIDVKASYKDHLVNCDKIDLIFSEDIAILSENLIYKKSYSHSLYADRMEIDLISKKSKIYMINNKKRVKIVYKGQNGNN